MLRTHIILKILGAAFLLSVKIITVQGLSCFSCYGIGHPRFCDHISQCTGNEVCGIQKYSDPSGEIFFNLGCVVSDICHSKRSGPYPSKICIECCTTDFCNIEGCGEHGPQGQLTSLCFNCKGLRPGEECHRVTGCDQNEACPSALTQGQIFGKRSTRDLCQRCCDGILCNIDCSSTHGKLEPLSNPMSTEFRLGSSYSETFIIMFIVSKQPTICHYFDINNVTMIDLPFNYNNIAFGGAINKQVIPNQIYVLKCDAPVSLHAVHIYHNITAVSFSFILPNGKCSTLSCIEGSRRVILSTVDKDADQLPNVPLSQGINSSIDLSQNFIIPNFANDDIYLKVSMDHRICNINAFYRNLDPIPIKEDPRGLEYTIMRFNVSQSAPFTLTSNCFISVQYLFKPTPTAIFVPGVDKYLSYYLFPTIENMSLYIVIPSSFVSSLYVDNLPVNPSNTTRIKTNFGNLNEYTSIGVKVQPGRHVVESKENIRFGLWVYIDNSGVFLPVGYRT